MFMMLTYTYHPLNNVHVVYDVEIYAYHPLGNEHVTRKPLYINPYALLYQVWRAAAPQGPASLRPGVRGVGL